VNDRRRAATHIDVTTPTAPNRPTSRSAGGATIGLLAAVLLGLASGCSSLAAAAQRASAAPLDDRQQACLECAIRRHQSAQSSAAQFSAAQSPAAEPPSAEALAHFHSACGAGDVRACSVLGVMYEQGHIVPRDEGRAMQLFQYACLHHNAAACVSLGGLFIAGPRRDEDAAALMYQVGCEAGSAEGCQRLARLRRATSIESANSRQ
jgi:TPR repeat protein